jgi:hypothetical protein
MAAHRVFLYLHCIELAPMRRFYRDLVGLDEVYFSEEEATAGYRVGTLELSISEHAAAQTHSGWARQLGWQGGESAGTSWGFELVSSRFDAAVERLVAAGVPTRHATPVWVGYRSFPVLDPMGNTVELSSVAGADDERPDTTT